MILLKLKGNQVIGVVLDIAPTYKPKEDEILIEELPHVDLKENEKAYIFWRNNQIEYEIKGE